MGWHGGCLAWQAGRCRTPNSFGILRAPFLARRQALCVSSAFSFPKCGVVLVRASVTGKTGKYPEAGNSIDIYRAVPSQTRRIKKM
jgi:hypothetical protein